MSSSKTLIGSCCSILIVILILVCVVYVFRKYKSDDIDKEGFLIAPDGSITDSSTIRAGNAILTTGITEGNPEFVVSDVEEYNKGSDLIPAMGGAVVTGLDDQMASHVAIDTIRNNAQTSSGGNLTTNEMADISKLMKSSTNMSGAAIITRAGATPANIELRPGGHVGVIDKKYVNEAEQSQHVVATNSVTVVPGYDINPERLLRSELEGGYTSSFNRNKSRRVTCVPGGAEFNKRQIAERVKIQNGYLELNDDVTGQSTQIQLNPDASPAASGMILVSK